MLATTMEREGVSHNGLQQEKSREAMIITDKLWKPYVMGDEEIHALRGVSFEIQRNEYVAIVGPSGSGKSTLMNLIGCLDTPSQGEYWLNNKLVSQMDDDELDRKSTRLNSSHLGISYAVFCLKKKT